MILYGIKTVLHLEVTDADIRNKRREGMNNPTCNNSECIEFDCEFYENNGTEYGYCWASGCCTNEIDFDKLKGEQNDKY